MSNLSSPVSLLFQDEVSDETIEHLLLELNVKGVQVEDLLALVEQCRAKEINFHLQDENVVDICGTGGDGAGTFNISTAASLLVTAAGAKVLKHGNRSASSKVGSADVFDALGLDIRLDYFKALEFFSQNNFYFLFAPLYHPALARFAPIRKKLAVKTIFNLLGPLLHPAHLVRGLVGTASIEDQKLLSEVLLRRPVKHYWIVHSQDGLDEISLCGKTHVVEIIGTEKKEWIFDPRDYGYNYCELIDLKGADDSVSNAQIIKNIFSGKDEGPKRDVVLLNAAALWLVYSDQSFSSALDLMRSTLNSGKAQNLLDKLSANP